MILNILKLIFIYFVYRLIKVLIKGYIKKKLRQAAESMNDQMNKGFEYHHNGQKDKSQKPPSQSNNSGSPKTFDAEYKVIKD